MMSETIILQGTVDEISVYLNDILCNKYGKSKTAAMVKVMINIVESSLNPLTVNHIVALIGDAKTGEVFIRTSPNHSYICKEAKVLVPHLKFSRWLPWMSYKVRVRS